MREKTLFFKALSLGLKLYPEYSRCSTNTSWMNTQFINSFKSQYRIPVFMLAFISLQKLNTDFIYQYPIYQIISWNISSWHRKLGFYVTSTLAYSRDANTQVRIPGKVFPDCQL